MKWSKSLRPEGQKKTPQAVKPLRGSERRGRYGQVMSNRGSKSRGRRGRGSEFRGLGEEDSGKLSGKKRACSGAGKCVKKKKQCYTKNTNEIRRMESMIIDIILGLVFGGLAGFCASKLMKDSNGIIVNIILGIVGGFVAGLILGLVGLNGAGGAIGSFIASVLGACGLIYVWRKVLKK